MFSLVSSSWESHMLVYFHIFHVQSFLDKKPTLYISFHYTWYCRLSSMYRTHAENGFSPFSFQIFRLPWKKHTFFLLGMVTSTQILPGVPWRQSCYIQDTLCSLFLNIIISEWITAVFLRHKIAESRNHFMEHLYPVDISRIQRHLRSLKGVYFINPNSKNNFNIFLRSYLL